MRKKLRYLVTGRDGQVVRALMERTAGAEYEYIELVAAGRPALDLSLSETIHVSVAEIKPDLIISAAAYTAVDQAESDEGTAFKVNGLGPRVLAEVAADRDIPIVHLSTDYVFDGSKKQPYLETDPVSPVSAYGRTKLEGERNLLSAHANVAILRTAWVYSPYGKNFAKTMLRLAETRDSINVVADQFGNPTSALDIADGILQVASNLIGDKAEELRGIFHMSGRGDASWADFASEIFRISADMNGPAANVRPISTSEYPTPAVRPSNSRLDNGTLLRRHGVELPQWQLSTRSVVERLVENKSYL